MSVTCCNVDTGELFDSVEEAVLDAGRLYSSGDEGGFVTMLGFPDEGLPCIEVDEAGLQAMLKLFPSGGVRARAPDLKAMAECGE